MKKKELFKKYFCEKEVGVAIIRRRDYLMQVNQKLEGLLGYTKEELQGYSWVDLTHPQDVQRTLGIVTELLEGKIDHCSMTNRFIKKDGSFIWIHVLVSKICRENEEYVLVVFEDESKWKKLELKLETIIQDSDEGFLEGLLNSKKVEDVDLLYINNRREFFRCYLKTPLCANMQIIQVGNQRVCSKDTDICILDIGAGGVKFLTDLKLAVNPVIYIRIKMNILGNDLDLPTKILRIKKREDGLFEYGAEFNISQEETENLIRICNDIAIAYRNKQPLHDSCLCTEIDCYSCFQRREIMA